MAKQAAAGLIRINKIPHGEAPEWVRKAWVGLELPCVGVMSFGKGAVTGVKSGKETQVELLGLCVPQKDALEALEKVSRGAADWWADEGYPKPISVEDGYFFFNESEAEILGGVTFPRFRVWNDLDQMWMP